MHILSSWLKHPKTKQKHTYLELLKESPSASAGVTSSSSFPSHEDERDGENWPGVKHSSSPQRNVPFPVFKMAFQAFYLFTYDKTIDSRSSSISFYIYKKNNSTMTQWQFLQAASWEKGCHLSPAQPQQPGWQRPRPGKQSGIKVTPAPSLRMTKHLTMSLAMCREALPTAPLPILPVI